jgi:enoyl-CoA hydratase/carnithine racemase
MPILPNVDFETIECEVGEGILTVTLSRPDRLNAFTELMADELISALDRADEDDEVRAIVFTGSGRAFCAGADLSSGGNTFAYEGYEGPVLADGTPRDGGGRVTLRMFESTKPLIAAINGPAVGVGVTMTLPMDIRLASSDAKFGFAFTRRGIVLEACSSWFLPRAVGITQALDWVVTGRVFGPDEALRGGLVRSVHEPDQLLVDAHAIGREIAANTAPASVAVARRLLWSMLAAPSPMEAHEVDSRAMQARGRSADVREGVEAFLEKRPPRFTDSIADELSKLGLDSPVGAERGRGWT